jgi:putative transposase
MKKFELKNDGKEGKIKVTKSLIVEYEKNEEMERLLEGFKNMVNFCIERGLKYGYSLKKLHENCYKELKKIGYNALIIASSYRIAQSIIRSWKANKGKEKPVAKKKLIRLHKSNQLAINYKLRQKIFLKLRLSDYHKKRIKNASKIGEILVNEKCVYIPLIYEVNLIKPEKFVAIDVNENNIAFVSSDGKAEKIKTRIRELKVGYEEKRRKIQKIRNKKRREKLLKKYREREKNRTKNALHKISKFIAENFKGYGIIMEDLKCLRRTVNRKVKKLNKYSHKIQKICVNSKFMKFRLNSFPFRMIQFYIQYKSLFSSSPVYFVNLKNTSKICFRCEGLINSSKFCPKCGLDRDINACLNLLKMWGLPPPESLFNANMTLPLTKKDEEKVEDLSRRGIGGNWILRTKKVAELIEKCYPYLIVKKPQAEVILEYRKTVWNHRETTVEDINRRRELVEKIRKLNTDKEYKIQRVEKKTIITKCPFCKTENERDKGKKIYTIICKNCGKTYKTNYLEKLYLKIPYPRDNINYL